MNGVQKEAAAFEGPDYRLALVGTPFEGVKRFRTLGPFGPMYEVRELRADRVYVHIYDNGEDFDFPAADALQDPLAE